MDYSCSKSSNNRMIPFANPNAQFTSYKRDIEESILKVVRGNNYVLGEEVKLLEDEFSQYIGSRFTIGVANGTDAIEISLRALGIGISDEVITVSHTAVASVAGIEASGAIPVLVDIEKDFYTLDIKKLAEVISEKTKAILLVHLYGHPANIFEIKEFCEKNNIYLIEDASQAHGASLDNEKVGSIGDIGCFSCYPTKNLGAIGDAGLITTNNSEIATKVKAIREYGWNGKRYISTICGRNSRIDEIQAAILRIKLKHLNKDNKRRVEIANIYSKYLKDTYISTPKKKDLAEHVFHLYVVRLDDRDALSNFLRKQNIITGIHYPLPIHLQPAYKNRLKTSHSMKTTEEISKQILSLPIYPEIKNTQIEFILENIFNYLRIK